MMKNTNKKRITSVALIPAVLAASLVSPSIAHAQDAKDKSAHEMNLTLNGDGKGDLKLKVSKDGGDAKEVTTDSDGKVKVDLSGKEGDQKLKVSLADDSEVALSDIQCKVTTKEMPAKDPEQTMPNNDASKDSGKTSETPAGDSSNGGSFFLGGGASLDALNKDKPSSGAEDTKPAEGDSTPADDASGAEDTKPAEGDSTPADDASGAEDTKPADGASDENSVSSFDWAGATVKERTAEAKKIWFKSDPFIEKYYNNLSKEEKAEFNKEISKAVANPAFVKAAESGNYDNESETGLAASLAPAVENVFNKLPVLKNIVDMVTSIPLLGGGLKKAVSVANGVLNGKSEGIFGAIAPFINAGLNFIPLPPGVDMTDIRAGLQTLDNILNGDDADSDSTGDADGDGTTTPGDGTGTELPEPTPANPGTGGETGGDNTDTPNPTPVDPGTNVEPVSVTKDLSAQVVDDGKAIELTASEGTVDCTATLKAAEKKEEENKEEDKDKDSKEKETSAEDSDATSNTSSSDNVAAAPMPVNTNQTAPIGPKVKTGGHVQIDSKKSIVDRILDII